MRAVIDQRVDQAVNYARGKILVDVEYMVKMMIKMYVGEKLLIFYVYK